jgi:uncharacterized protein YbjT (DUF2867 family)
MEISNRMVAVTGATGRQGGAVTAHLLAAGWRVRALTRKPNGAPARRLAALGAEVVGADMADRDALVRAFSGAHGVYSVQNSMISGVEAEITQGKNVGEAAKHVNVQHLVYGSAGLGFAGTGVGSWESKLTVQAHLESLGLPLTVLRPTAFMELMTDRDFFPPVSTWNLMPRFTGPDTPIGWICVDDLGAVAALAFADTDRFVGRTIGLVADVQSNDECRDTWREVTGRPPRRYPMPVWMFKRFVGTDLITMWQWLRTERPDFDPSETRALLPAAATVREWLTGRHQPSVKAV